jgi:rare lipoprotein A (peptidoglycan hydrolase)
MQRSLVHGLAFVFLFASLKTGEGPNNSKPQAASTKKPEVVQQAGKAPPYQIGTASWYGQDFHGKPTASGEPYNMYDMTAAHRTIPLGTYVQVTNLHNGRAVVVKVNDRGPIIPGRIIDLSYAAARELRAWHEGLLRVRIDVTKRPHVRTAHQNVADNNPTIE